MRIAQKAWWKSSAARAGDLQRIVKSPLKPERARPSVLMGESEKRKVPTYLALIGNSKEVMPCQSQQPDPLGAPLAAQFY
jgi:hypothetical protein